MTHATLETAVSAVKAKDSWTAGQNQRFQDMTLGEIKTLMGALPESDEMKADPRTGPYFPVFFFIA